MTSRAKNFLIVLLAVAAIGGLFWLASRLGSGEKVQSEKPLVICNPPQAPPEEQRCFWTADIHARVTLFKGGEKFFLNFEQGDLNGVHTHSERNLIHWHGLIPADAQTKEVKDWSAMRVDKMPKDLGLTLEGQPRFFINGEEVEPSHIWQDEDAVEIRY